MGMFWDIKFIKLLANSVIILLNSRGQGGGTLVNYCNQGRLENSQLQLSLN